MKIRDMGLQLKGDRDRKSTCWEDKRNYKVGVTYEGPLHYISSKCEIVKERCC